MPRIRGLRESAFWLLAGVGVILLLALLSYSPVDPAFSVAGGSDTVVNRMGPASAYRFANASSKTTRDRFLRATGEARARCLPFRSREGRPGKGSEGKGEAVKSEEGH